MIVEDNDNPIILKTGFSSRKYPSIFTSKAPVTKKVNWKKLSFVSTEIEPIPSQVQCDVGQIQVQRPTLTVNIS